MENKRKYRLGEVEETVSEIIPYILFLIFPQFVGLGLFGIICIGMGFGDYLNIYNAIKQMPKNSKTYLCGMHSYWYL